MAAAEVSSAQQRSIGKYRASLFHQINLDYPGMEVISEEPYILRVPNFCSPEETQELIAKIDAADASDSSELLAATGERTSVSVLAHDDEVAGLRVLGIRVR